MATTLLHKRSSTTTAVPTTGDLALGEIAINDNDGKIFIEKNDGSPSIVTFNPVSDAAATILGNTSGTNSGDEVQATTSLEGVSQIATAAEVDTGTADSGFAISPLALAGSALQSKVDGIEALADVTDATNVAAAGAVMESDTTTALMSFVIDEDTFASDLDTKVPTQQSVKAYVASQITSGMVYQGAYNASTNTPALDTGSPSITVGDTYTVTVAGTFFTVALEVGDVLIAEVTSADAADVGDWTIVQANLTAASIKTQYESNADTNEFSDAEQTLLSNQSGTNTGDEPAASTTVVGVVELAIAAECTTGTDDTRAVTPLALATCTIDGGSY